MSQSSIKCPLCREPIRTIDKIDKQETCIICEKNQIGLIFNCKHSCSCIECFEKMCIYNKQKYYITYEDIILHQQQYPDMIDSVNIEDVNNISVINAMIMNSCTIPNYDYMKIKNSKLIPQNIKILWIWNGTFSVTNEPPNINSLLYVTKHMTNVERKMVFIEGNSNNTQRFMNKIVSRRHITTFMTNPEENKINFKLFNNVGLIVLYLDYNTMTHIVHYSYIEYKNNTEVPRVEQKKKICKIM